MHWKRSKYIIENRDKYIGTKMPVYKSSWEQRVMKFLDINENVRRWGYENVVIPYIGIDGKKHDYYMDFYVEIYDKNNKLQKYLIEVKPIKDGKPPKKPKIRNKKAMQNYLYQLKTYKTNYLKWKSVLQYCKNKNIKFRVFTENKIFNRSGQ